MQTASNADAYLRHVSRVRSTYFSKGYVDTSISTAALAQAPHNGNGDAHDVSGVQAQRDATPPAVLAVDVATTQRLQHRLPMKRQRRHFTSDDDSDNDAAAATTTAPTADSDAHAPCDVMLPVARAEASAAAGAVCSPTSPTRRRVSLIDKWFPGMLLKEATLEAAQAPTSSYIVDTVQRVTAMRERVITLRGAVEDMDALLATMCSDAEAGTCADDTGASPQLTRALVHSDTRRQARHVLLQLFGVRATSPRSVHALMTHYVRSRTAAAAVAASSHGMRHWHDFVSRRGPESGGAPLLSHLLWLSSADTTALFTVLTQRFLRAFRTTAATRVHSPSVPHTPAQASEHATDERSKNDEPQAAVSCSSATGAASATSGWLHDTQPHFADALTDAQRRLLVFLRYLMPTSLPDCSLASSGWGVWLLAALCALDAPLDPDTDRLAHELFRACCEQVRVLSEWKGVRGECRGALADAFAAASVPHEGAGHAMKQYATMQEIGKGEVAALHTLIIVLAKFFRQNQNRLIPL